ncbi:hypothetical protein TSACC_2597 [Terrimicrobium sacchariphilum]|uniref:Uncharacterized protein n=1 Tax=Terrimicrobium sacchariphilum TaxID=690879 RepID=A0A146G2X4_TERSA|nr:hypothetical protein [Terrimicrobium sacchariphilum]GAT32199.1 hypothetical protein TSACC_2597 [Terrimicrobium sacchariphilum]
MRLFPALCLQVVVVALACAGTASYMRLRGDTELLSGVQDACLPVAQAVRNRLREEGVANRILLVDYELNSYAWHHVAVVFALEDGTLASFESLNSLAAFNRGSVALGISDWNAMDIAERLPRQGGVTVRDARWIDGLTYESTQSAFMTGVRR